MMMESTNNLKIVEAINRGDLSSIRKRVDKMRKAGELNIDRYIEYSNKVFRRIGKLFEDGFASEEYYEETREIKLYFNLLGSYDELLASSCIDLKKISKLIIDYDIVKNEKFAINFVPAIYKENLLKEV